VAPWRLGILHEHLPRHEQRIVQGRRRIDKIDRPKENCISLRLQPPHDTIGSRKKKPLTRRGVRKKGYSMTGVKTR
jgi:hypothetical protein